MKVNCLCCGHTVDLRDAYDDYEGLIKCFACGACLRSARVRVRLNGWSLRATPKTCIPPSITPHNTVFNAYTKTQPA